MELSNRSDDYSIITGKNFGWQAIPRRNAKFKDSVIAPPWVKNPRLIAKTS
jgi:hypothetical protein